MNRLTRDKFASGTNQRNLTGGNAVWETPPIVYQALNEQFGPFDVCICADPMRARTQVWFGPGSPYLDDALKGGWWQWGHNGYCNPPYGAFVQKILRVAREEAQRFQSTFLLPMRVTKAFKEIVLPYASELLFCNRRITFFENGVPRVSVDAKGRMTPNPALFDSIIVRFVPGHQGGPRVGVWKVPPHVTEADLERARERMLGRAA